MRFASLVLLAAMVGTPDAVADDQGWKGRARIDGRVAGEGGAPLPGATIRISRSSGGRGPATVSDADGGWVIDGIAAGSWVVVIEAAGYRTERVGVHLPGESSWLAPIEVRLGKTPPASPVPASTAAPARPAGPSSIAARTARQTELEEIRAALEAGRPDRARELLEFLDEDEATDAGGLVEVGLGFLAAGATAEAAACFDVALARDPGHTEAHYRRGLARLALGQPDTARRDFESVLSLQPDGALARKARSALEALGAVRGDE